MKAIPTLATALLLILPTFVAAQSRSLSTTWGPTYSSVTAQYSGDFFDIVVLNPAGIRITGWDAHCASGAGINRIAQLWYRQGSYVGFETDPQAWTYVGEGTTVSAGPGTPTPVPVGDLYLPPGTYGFRLGFTFGGVRQNDQSSFVPTHSNADLRIESGAAQNGSFTTNIVSPRSWNGTVYYTVGSGYTFGACCLFDGTCVELSAFTCHFEGGTFHGDNSSCATTPPGGCPLPPTGACCHDDAVCHVVAEHVCIQQLGIYRGDNTTCSGIDCPFTLTTTYASTATSLATQTGAFFDVTAQDPAGIIIDSFHMNLSSSAGTIVTVSVYVRPNTYAGWEEDISGWLPLGYAQVTSAGPGNRTHVPIGDLHLAAGESWGFRLGTHNGGQRFTSAATTTPLHSTDHVQIHLGHFQTAYFSGSTVGGWSGTLRYRLGAQVVTGACCFADGSCHEIRASACELLGGDYKGDQSTCSAGVCLQPGACCIAGACLERQQTECVALGGVFHGQGVFCAAAHCAPVVTANLIGLNLAFSSASAPDPQNWTRLTSGSGTLHNLQDDTGAPTSVGVQWSGEPSGSVSLNHGAWLAADAVPQHAYSLAGMTGFATRNGECLIRFTGLTPGAVYQYWFVAYRANDLINNEVWISDGEAMKARSFTQFLQRGLNDGRFVVNTVNASDAMQWDQLALATTSSSAGTITFHWNGSPTAVIGAVAIREVLESSCYADCDDNGILNIDDFICFINTFAQYDPYADCDGNSIFNIDDFICFINEFAGGCP